MSSIEEKLAKAAGLMNEVLAQSTGLHERDRKLLTYYALATHALARLETFPLLVLIGKMGTGKSQAEKIVGQFARNPLFFSLRNMTLAVIRDEFAKGYEGTVIIEEADQAWRDSEAAFERLLSDRYQRDSAKAEFKEKCGDNWKIAVHNYFGATVLHRRTPFNDAALDGRSVAVRFRADHSRKYVEYSGENPLMLEGRELLSRLAFDLPRVEQPVGIAARIFNSYRPLLSVGKICGDESFMDAIHESLLLATADLKEAQSAEPDGLVLRAILDATNSDGYSYIKLSTLSDSILRNHKIVLQPRQIAAMARELGFATKNSHGVTVVVPTPATLLKACEICGYEEDEAVAELKRNVLGSPRVERVEKVDIPLCTGRL